MYGIVWCGVVWWYYFLVTVRQPTARTEKWLKNYFLHKHVCTAQHSIMGYNYSAFLLARHKTLSDNCEITNKLIQFYWAALTDRSSDKLASCRSLYLCQTYHIISTTFPFQLCFLFSPVEWPAPSSFILAKIDWSFDAGTGAQQRATFFLLQPGALQERPITTVLTDNRAFVDLQLHLRIVFYKLEGCCSLVCT